MRSSKQETHHFIFSTVQRRRKATGRLLQATNCPAYIPMSALGQKQTSAHVRVMSALPPKADIAESDWYVWFVPNSDISRRNNLRCYSITSSAMESSPGDMVRPNALAVFILITSSNFVG